MLVLEPLSAGTPQRILAVLIVTLVPYSLVGPFAGVLVDRWDRRRLLVGAALVRALLLLSFSAWAPLAPGQTELYAGTLTLLGLGRLWLTTKSAVLPMVVAAPRLLRANATSGGAGMVGAFVGGVLGVTLAGVLGTTGAFAVAGAIYLACAAFAVTLPVGRPAAGPAREPLGEALSRVASQLVEGIAYLWGHVAARLSLAAIFLARVLVLLVAIVAVFVIQREYPDAGDRLGRLSAGGIALATAGAGAFAGTVTAGLLGRRLSGPALMLWGFSAAGAAVMALGGIQDLVAVAGLTFASGLGSAMVKVAVDAEIQEVLANDFHGRAFSVYDILYNMASVLAGVVVVAFGSGPLRILVLAAGTLALVLALLLRAAMGRAGMVG